MAVYVNMEPPDEFQTSERPTKAIALFIKVFKGLEGLFAVLASLSAVCAALYAIDVTMTAEDVLMNSALCFQNVIQYLIWFLLIREARHVASSIAAGREEPLSCLARASRAIALILFVSALVGLLLTLGTTLLAQEPIRAIDFSVQLPGFPQPSAWREALDQSKQSLDGVFLINVTSFMMPVLFWLLSLPLEDAARLQKEQELVL